MRKSLLFLATAALFASCSDDMLERGNGFQAQDLNNKGITFTVVDDAATRGMIDTDHSAFFFAEKDRISVWARNAKHGYDKASQSFQNVTGTDWRQNVEAKVDLTKPFTYKATSSDGYPDYTAVDDANMLDLKSYNGSNPNANKADFFVAYPADPNPAGGEDVAHIQTINYANNNFTITPNKNLMIQQMNGYMNMDARLMYDYAQNIQKTANDPKEDNKSVGEKVQLVLQSPLSTILFKYDNLGGYNTPSAGLADSKLGTLKSVTITSERSPLVPAINGTNITVENPDLIRVGSEWYLKSEVTARHKTYNQTGNWVQIGPNTYDRSTCQVDESGTWHVTDKSRMIDKNDQDPNGPIDGWNINSGATPKAKNDLVNIDYTGTFTFNTTNEKMSYNSNKQTGAYHPLAYKARLNVANVGIGKEMNLFVLPVERNGVNETYTVTYSYTNADLVVYRTTSNNFLPNTGARTLAMDVAGEFKYIVTKGDNATSDRTLIINSGNVKDVINDDGSVNWLDEFELEKVNKDYIKTVVIKSGVNNLTDADWTDLNRLTSTATLVIENNTEELKNVRGMASTLKKLYADRVTKVNNYAFNSTNGSTIEILSLANVGSSVEHAFPQPDQTRADRLVKFTTLKELYLNSYEFSEEQVNDIQPEVFFNTSTAAATTGLQKLNLSAVKSFAPLFAWQRTISFKDFKSLAEVTVKNDAAGVIFTQSEFAGCTALTKLTGVCDIDIAASAFEGCDAAGFTTVHIAGDMIPIKAFKNSNVKTIYKGTGNTKNDLAKPTSIGLEAFDSDKAIQELDLTQATEIGARAFNNATNFYGTGAGKNYVVTLVVDRVKSYAFHNTKVQRFQLINATTTEDHSLYSTVVEQIKYMKSGLRQFNNNNGIHSDQSKKDNVEIFIFNKSDFDLFYSTLGYPRITVGTDTWDY